jgi:deoxycytidylate deaminase
MHKFLKQAIDEAQKSEHKQKMGAIIFDKSKIISKGFNHPQRSVKHLKKKFQRWPGTVHAEVDAILKAKSNLKNLSMLVVRINNKNQLRLARPCRWCQMYLEYVGIKKVYYSINEFPYIKEIKL